MDVYKILLWELFICVIAYLRHIKDYEAINILLTYTYFLENSLFGGEIKQTNYTTFRHHSFVIEEHYKPMSQMKDKYTLVGNIICSQREKFPIYTAEAIAEADYFYIRFVMPMIFLKMSEFGMALVGFLHVIFMLKIKG